LALKVYASNTEVLTENFLDLFESESKSEPNPNGQIVHLTSDDFEKKNC
jgi:hypothetical protein